MQQFFGWLALVGLAGPALTLFPLWKSAKLSPDSIKRRVWWAGSTITILSLFVSQLPFWQGGLFLALGAAVGLGAIAARWTNFIKINGRVISASRSERRPDRRPALQDDDDRS